MNYSEIIASAFYKLKKYCEQEMFKGWDPYDGLNSKLFQAAPFLSKKRLSRLAWIQFFKRSPFNFRRVAGVEKGVNPKGLALFIAGYCNILKMERSDKNEIGQKIEQLSDELLHLKSEGYSWACWGYNFDWESKAFFLPKFTPTIVVTTFAANALLDAYEATGNKQYFETAISAKQFLLKGLKRTALDDGSFAFSYSPFDQTSVFNASMLGAKLLSRIYSYTREEELVKQAKKAVQYCVNFQNEDGSWYYSRLPFHQWIDNFHTGFNLECIAEYSHFTGDRSFANAFKKGMKYYLNTFFDAQGRSKYYNNQLFPIDVHAPAQLVVTLSKTNLFKENKDLMDRVLYWTIQHMQSKKGYFYYQKRKLYTNKIVYMRWSQAWMFYGLSYYLRNTAI
jgi:rhamnogalacturonyl hydrolase YesR